MTGFKPPPYPFDRLIPLRQLAEATPGGLVNLSIGTPCDRPPAVVTQALAQPDDALAYPPSVGTPAYREAAAAWLHRRFGVALDPAAVAACVGTKEFVAGIPQWLRLRDPKRDTVLYPAISYPTYEMGAVLAGCRSVAVPLDDRGRLRLETIGQADAERALCLWVNTPGNPTGALEDLAAVAEWGRSHDVIVLSDECYAEFTWAGVPRTILEHGIDGVLAVHSLSKRSNMAGARAGFYAGDPDLVGYLGEVRKHAGFMVPSVIQAAGARAWSEDEHVALQAGIYRDRLALLVEGLGAVGLDATLPEGAFYLWVPAPDGDAWRLAEDLARRAGVLVSPGELYGADGAGHVRVAAVQPAERIAAAMKLLER